MAGEDLGAAWGNSGDDLGADWGGNAVPVIDPKTQALYQIASKVTPGAKSSVKAHRVEAAGMGTALTPEQGAVAIAGRSEEEPWQDVAKAFFPRTYAQAQVDQGFHPWLGIKDASSLLGRAAVGLGSGVNALAGGSDIASADDAALQSMSSPASQGSGLGRFARDFATDPLLIPSLAVGGPLASRAGTLLAFPGSVPTFRAAGTAGAILGAGAADRASDWDPNTQAEPSAGELASAIAMSAFPELAGLGGKMLGRRWFPGINAGTNRNVPEPTREMVAKNLDEILSPGMLPRTRGSFLDMAAKRQRELGQRYEAALSAVPQEWVIMTDDVGDRFRQNLRSRLGDRSALVYDPAKGEAALPAAAENAVEGVMDRVRGAQAYRGQMPDLANARDLAKLRNDLTNPETWRDPSGELAMLKKDVGRAFHGGVNDVLMSVEPYANTLGTDTPRQYALWSGLEDLVDNPGRLGLADRLPVLNFAVSPWLKSSLAYKTGQAASRLGSLLPYIQHATQREP